MVIGLRTLPNPPLGARLAPLVTPRPTTLRLPRETLARWKATGPGWQTRMAEVLSRAL